MFSRSPGALSCLAACRNCNRDHNMRSWHPREELFLLMDVDYDCVWCFLLFCLSILFILLPHYPHVPLTRRFGLPPLALYDPCRRSGVWNLCSGEGGPCLIHWTVGRASSVIFSDQFFQHEFQHIPTPFQHQLLAFIWPSGRRFAWFVCEAATSTC